METTKPIKPLTPAGGIERPAKGPDIVTTFIPAKGKILIEPIFDGEGLIIKPNSAEPKGVVRAIGQDVTEYSVGDMVTFRPTGGEWMPKDIIEKDVKYLIMNDYEPYGKLLPKGSIN